MNLNDFLAKLEHNPSAIEFTDTMTVIEQLYAFTPTAFDNGSLTNAAGENSGSCKLFAFAQLQKLTAAQTLHCFGQYYRTDVLTDVTGSNHGNIRNFMASGWQGIVLHGVPLSLK